jgi:hypothetical protein
MRGARRLRRAAACALAVSALAPASSADAASLIDDRRQAATGTAAGSCFRADRSDPGVDAQRVKVRGPAVVRATLEGKRSSDWDLAVLERGTDRVIAASAQRGSDELAEGFVADATRTIVQACRRSGGGGAELDVATTGIEPSDAPAPTAQLVRVSTPTAAAKKRLQALDLDLTEHGGEDHLGVVTYGAADLATLDANGFEYEVEIQDLTQKALQDRAADTAFKREARDEDSEAAALAAEIPSGRTTYRRLFDFQDEMKQLAEDNPDLVRPLTLPHRTWEGRPVEGIEITTDPDNLDDGKPVYLQMGAHHAREWPSSEHAMEYAHELIEGYRDGDDRIEQLVEGSRTIVVPVVNPDGFNVSREAGQLLGVEGGRSAANELESIIHVITIAYEYWRKNCRLPDDSPAGRCLGQPLNTGISHSGVDPNRNYGGLWGGPGASSAMFDPTYRGSGPFSEPETQNVHELVSQRQVTMLISNHTFSNLWLRPPGQNAVPDSPDEALLAAIGAAATAENGYSNIQSRDLYETTGSTEDWTYWSAGGLGYTPEIGCREKSGNECLWGDFHGTYADHVVTEYGGGSPSAPTGGGNREAYLIAHESALDPDHHSLISGEAPPDATIRVQKTFETETWQGDHGTFQDHLETAMDVPDSGEFDFHVNPSTRPISQVMFPGREPTGDPSPPESFSGDVTTAAPCGDYDSEDPACIEDHAFTVPSGPGIDNAEVTVRIDWATIGSDWDLRIFRDSNGDGSSIGETEEVAASGQGTTTFEEATFAEPFAPDGKYVARVINYAAADPYQGTVTFDGPQPPRGPGPPEAWNLTCELKGKVRASIQVFVGRGERSELDLSRCKAKKPKPKP